MKVGRTKALARWVSWIFGLALLASVVMFALHYRQEKALAQLLRHARPAWLLVALLLQMGTYTTDARIWQRVRAVRTYRGGSAPMSVWGWRSFSWTRPFLALA